MHMMKAQVLCAYMHIMHMLWLHVYVEKCCIANLLTSEGNLWMYSSYTCINLHQGFSVMSLAAIYRNSLPFCACFWHSLLVRASCMFYSSDAQCMLFIKSATCMCYVQTTKLLY